MLGWQEIILILAILLLVVGPDKLPKLAKELGKAWNIFTNTSSEIMETMSSTQVPEKDDRSKLISEVAKKLCVDTDGKTDDQLTKEILTQIINRSKTPTTTKEA
jgi:sec-independent protein translocase protein TatA